MNFPVINPVSQHFPAINLLASNPVEIFFPKKVEI